MDHEFVGLAGVRGVETFGPLDVAPVGTAIKGHGPSVDPSSVIKSLLLDLLRERLDLIHGFGFDVSLNEAVYLWHERGRHVVRLHADLLWIRIGRALAVFPHGLSVGSEVGVYVGVVAVEHIPVAWVELDRTGEGDEADLVVLLLEDLEPSRAVHDLQVVFESGLEGFLFEDGHQIASVLIGRGDRESEPFAGCILQNSVRSRLVVAGLCEVFARLLRIEAPRLDRGVHAPTIAVGAGLQSHGIATMILLTDQVEVRRIVQTDADVHVIQARLGGVDPQSPVGTRNSIVELVT